MKQNVSETEGNWRFRKKCKNMSSKEESVSDGRVTAATCKYYCPLVVNSTITNYVAMHGT